MNLRWIGLWLACFCAVFVQGDSGGDFFKTSEFIHPGKPGPWVKATRGQVWPQPKLSRPNGNKYSLIHPEKFTFKLDTNSASCDLIQNAVNRFYLRTFPRRTEKTAQIFDADHPWFKALHQDPNFRGVLESVQIVMNTNKGCEKYPHLDMDEHYEVKIDAPDSPKTASIIAFNAWGILRGFETFSQLVYSAEEHGGLYQVNSVQVMDQPRFSHRGVMLDSSRHFLSKRVIFDNLDLMEMNKMNVFHWHISDDPAFPYESLRFPNMSLKGAYRPYTHVYSQEDIREIIEYARLRGIRVISEFDTPGHTQSWELGQPGLLTKCYRGSQPDGNFGPFDPTKDSLYDFLEVFFKEIGTVFPDKFMHLGGDEVDKMCWQSNPHVMEFVQKNLGGNLGKLESYYIQKLLPIIAKLPTKNGYIVWQEVFDNKDEVKNDTIIHVWKGGPRDWANKLQQITSTGLRALLSAPWYLNYINYGSDWTNYYNIEPLSFTGSEAQKKLFMGGEACIWGEFVSSVNLIPRLWPRASAVAERLWSPEHVRDVKVAASRLQEHECRMLQRGYPVEPANGPSFCDVAW